MNKSIIYIGLVTAALGTSMAAIAQDHRGEGDREHGDARAMGNTGGHNWHKGDRMPEQYRRNEYVVGDWRSHQLREPPRGYHWVNDNGDFVLVAITSGIIADLVLNGR